MGTYVFYFYMDGPYPLPPRPPRSSPHPYSPNPNQTHSIIPNSYAPFARRGGGSGSGSGGRDGGRGSGPQDAEERALSQVGWVGWIGERGKEICVCVVKWVGGGRLRGVMGVCALTLRNLLNVGPIPCTRPYVYMYAVLSPDRWYRWACM